MGRMSGHFTDAKTRVVEPFEEQAAESRPVSRIFLRILPYLAPAALLSLLLLRMGSIVITEIPNHDEAELLHASWLMAHGAIPWIDFFENHSPIYLWLNAKLLSPDAVFYVVQARVFHFLIYLCGAALFAWACYVWLGVERAFSRSFLLLSAIVYFSLTWPVDFGLVRPEAYAFAVLFCGAVFAHAKSARSLMFGGVLLALAATLSPRAAPLSVIVELVCIARLSGYRARVQLLMIFAAGAALTVLLNAAAAPLDGFYRWLINFDGHIRPYRRALPTAAFTSVSIALLALTVSAVAPIFIKPVHIRSVQATLGRLATALAIGPPVIIGMWAYVFLDKSWGREGFGGIAVASAFYVCVLIAVGQRLYRRRGLKRFLLWLVLTFSQGISVLWKAGASPAPETFLIKHDRLRVRPIVWRWRQAGLAGILIVAIGGLFRVGLGSGLMHWVHAAPAWLHRQFADTPQVPPLLRENISVLRYFLWPGWILVPGFFILAALALHGAFGLSPWRRALNAAIALRVQFVLLAVGGAALLGMVLGGAPHLAAPLIGWPPAGLATGFAVAMAVAVVWPSLRWSMGVFAAVIAGGGIGLGGLPPAKVAFGAAIGIAVPLLLRWFFARRALVFFVDAEGRIKPLPGPSWRRISTLPVDLALPSDRRGPIVISKLLATGFMLLTCLGLGALLHIEDTVLDEAGRLNEKGNLAAFQAVRDENAVPLTQAEDLLPLTQAMNLGQWVQWSRRYCMLLRNDHVAMDPNWHPVCVRDSSFYWYGGGPIQAMRKEHVPFVPSPPFAVDRDLMKTRPVLIDAMYLAQNGYPPDLGARAPEDMFPARNGYSPAFSAMLTQDYVPLKDRDHQVWAFARRDWLLLNSRRKLEPAEGGGR